MPRPTTCSVILTLILIGTGCGSGNDSEGATESGQGGTTQGGAPHQTELPGNSTKATDSGGSVSRVSTGSQTSRASTGGANVSVGGSNSRTSTGGVKSGVGGSNTTVSGGSNPSVSNRSSNTGASSGGTNSTASPPDPRGGTTSVSPTVVPTIKIDVANGAAITSKDESVPCTLTIDGQGSFADYSGTASIRGRGNSTWLWYEKKPYRIELDQKSQILGLKEDKDWVLLANYRDPTFLMNAFAFELADWMGLPYTNHSRFVEVTLNGDYIGLYQLTEQIEQGTNRVAVSDAGGLLLSLDEDDGPIAVPDATNNFASLVYEL